MERSRPGQPQDNGQHERLHRTMEEETGQSKQPELTAQQERYDGFRGEFNQIRPHEALNGLSPADFYRPSWRPLTAEAPGLDYPAHYERRQVRPDGTVKWHGEHIFISEVLAREPVGLVEIEDDVWAVYFASLRLGTLRQGKFNAEKRTSTRRKEPS